MTGFTADHRTLFKQFSVQRVLITYDGDDAGDRAAQKLAQKLAADGVACYRVPFPQGEGPAEPGAGSPLGATDDLHATLALR